MYKHIFLWPFWHVYEWVRATSTTACYWFKANLLEPILSQIKPNLHIKQTHDTHTHTQSQFCGFCLLKGSLANAVFLQIRGYDLEQFYFLCVMRWPLLWILKNECTYMDGGMDGLIQPNVHSTEQIKPQMHKQAHTLSLTLTHHMPSRLKQPSPINHDQFSQAD